MANDDGRDDDDDDDDADHMMRIVSVLRRKNIIRGSSGENWSSFYCFAKQPRKVAEGLHRNVLAAPFGASAIVPPQNTCSRPAR